MLTVKEINEVSFGKAGFSGYKPEDVDNFIDKVAASVQELLTELDTARKQAEDLAGLNTELAAKNADAQRKLSILAQKVEAYRQEEEGIKEAIISAQRMSKDLVREAQQKADGILQDARAQVEAKMTEANEEARKITHNAEENAAKAAKEYTRQADTKKAELEEIKRQVSAFRSSLLEMYKKHLECIDHIPVFRQKDEPQEPPATSGRTQEPEPAPKTEPPRPKAPEPPVAEPEPMPPVEPEPEPEPIVEPVRQAIPPVQPVQVPPELSAPRKQPPAPQGQAQASRQAQAAPRTVSPSPRTRQEPPRQAHTLNDRYNYVQEQLQPSRLPENYLQDNDLSAVGIDLTAHADIPEALRKEKDSHYSNLPFGDGVEVDGRKRKR